MLHRGQKAEWLRHRAAFHKRQMRASENEIDDLEVVSAKESLPDNPCYH
jgi:hypothetical protein